jgi:hypothetical protein
VLNASSVEIWTGYVEVSAVEIVVETGGRVKV